MSETITQRRLTSGDSHLAFQAMLRTLAEPGTVELLPTSGLADDAPAVAIPVLALADVEVTVSVDSDATHPLANRLARTTGAKVSELADAEIVVLTNPDPRIATDARRGTALAPELGARLIVRVDDIDPGPASSSGASGGRSQGVTVRVEGPGVPGERTISLAGVSPEFLRAIADANRAFPAGIDTWFVTDDGRICALSRSTRLTIEES